VRTKIYSPELAWFALKLSCVFAALREILRVQKLGKNLGGYHGETIDIRTVLRDIKVAAQQHGWASELFYKIGDLELFALHRTPDARHQTPNPGIYISAGTHGDEPAGPLAALKLIQENIWPGTAELWLLPCLNPEGFVLNTRSNAGGIDLNRDYRHPESGEVTAHVRWLERQPNFDRYLCLHEDWESHGFYLYEQNPDSRPSLAENIIQAVQPVCPIDLSENIEGRPAHGGIIRPNFNPQERPDWPEAFYLITHKARQGYTLEAPSDFPLTTRVNALVAAVRAALAG
jgi:murein peptide amidase A